MKKIFKYIKKHWIISIAIVFFIGFVIYKQLTPAKTEGEASYKIKKQNLKESLTFSGEINANEKFGKNTGIFKENFNLDNRIW